MTCRRCGVMGEAAAREAFGRRHLCKRKFDIRRVAVRPVPDGPPDVSICRYAAARQHGRESMSELRRRYVLTLFGAILLAASPVMAENRADRFEIPGPDHRVAVTPAVYFVNCLFLYFSNPHNAANMPAYRGPIPPQLATCLLDNPECCPYADYQQYFNGQDVCAIGNGGDKCRWELQVNPSSEAYARLRRPVFERTR